MRKQTCSYCHGKRWGLVRKYRFGHQFCSTKCLKLWTSRVTAEHVRAARFLRWLAS